MVIKGDNMENNFNFKANVLDLDSYDSSVLQYYTVDFEKMMEQVSLMQPIKNSLEDINLYEAPKASMAKAIYENILFFAEIFDNISEMLSFQPYIDLARSENGNYLKDQISYLKQCQKECGEYITKYAAYINKYADSYRDIFLQNYEAENNRFMAEQFNSAHGYNLTASTSLHQLIDWSKERAKTGYKLIKQFRQFDLGSNPRIAELHKGTFDSVFGHCRYDKGFAPYEQSISISPYIKLMGQDTKCIKGKLSYECGLTIKDNYSVIGFPQDIDTLLLYNPNNEKEIQTIKNAASEKNIIFSIFGSVDDKDYDIKHKIFDDLSGAIRSETGIEPKEAKPDKDDRCYIRTFYSQKNPK